MRPTTKRAPRFRDLQLLLAALLAFASWLGLVGCFIAFPLLYYFKVPLTMPILAGGFGLVAITFILYYLLAGSLRCQVCGGPVFGGGEGHRKHPQAQKFLGLSYSRKVAAEILTLRGFHCMHCQTFCRSRRRNEGLPEELINAPSAPALGAIFQPAAVPRNEPVTPSTALFQNIFNPSTPPDPIPQPAEPQSRVFPGPERTPWAHHPNATPFTKSDAMNTPPPPAASPRIVAAPVMPQEHSAPPPPTSPFSLLSVPTAAPVRSPMNVSLANPFSMDPSPVSIPPVPQQTPQPQPKHSASPFEGLTEVIPAKIQPPVTAPEPVAKQESPRKAAINGEAPGTEPDLKQVVAEVANLIEQTKNSLDQLFGEMVSQLRTTLAPALPKSAPHESPVPAPLSPVAAAVVPAPHPPTAPPEVRRAIPTPPTPSRIAAAAQPAAAPAPPVDPAKAAVLNDMLARAFAKPQNAPPPSAKPESAPVASLISPTVGNPSAAEKPSPAPLQAPFEIAPASSHPLSNPMAAFPFPAVSVEPVASDEKIFGGVPPLPPPWDKEVEEPGHPAPFTFLSQPAQPAQGNPNQSPEWSLPPLKQGPPPPINWPSPNGKA